MTDLVIRESFGNVCRLTLNRPHRRNAINPELVLAFRLALADANADDQVSVIVLRGAGEAFCSGNDLKDTAASEELENSTHVRIVANQLQDVTRQISGGPKIVVAAVHGWAVGAGFEWVIDCDFSVWARSARASFPELRWGLSATGGVLSLLPRIVGTSKAREMLLFGDNYDAEELLELGIAHQVVDDTELERATLDLATRIAALPATAVRRFKRSFAAAACATLEETLVIETDTLVESVTDGLMIEKIRQF